MRRDFVKQSSGFGMRSQGTDALPGRAPGVGKPATQIEFAGLALTLDASGAAYMCAQDTLIIADLHLEKGSRAASKGRLLPALDSRDTLHRLKRVLEAYRPERVICLGDSFDDCLAGERMAAADKDELSSLCASVDEWIWLGGNHDPETPAFCGGETRTEIEIGGAILRHEPAAACANSADCGPSPSEGQRAGRRLPLFRPLLLRFGGSAHHASLRRLCRRALMPFQSHPLAAQIGAQALHAPRREALARRLNWSAFRNPAVCNIIPETPEALSAMTATGWRSDQGL